MLAMMSKIMINVGNSHIHPGEVVFVDAIKGTGTYRVSHTKSRQDVFATIGSTDSFVPYPANEPIGQVVSVSEACDILGVDRSRVHNLLERGKLVGRKSGKAWILDRQSVETRAEFYQNAK